MNRAAALHNIQVQSPSLSKYIINSYRKESKLFITGGAEISSKEGTTQGDPLALAWYSIATSLSHHDPARRLKLRNNCKLGWQTTLLQQVL